MKRGDRSSALWIAACLSGLLGMAPAGLAVAQPRDPAGADMLFRQGREAMKAGDYARACAKFAESDRLDPATGTVLNLAQCEEKQGRFASALAHYRAAADALTPDDPRTNVARQGMASVEARVSRLMVRLASNAPAGTIVLRDGIELGGASLGISLPVDSGTHEVVTRAPGRTDSRRTVSLAEGGSLQVIAQVGEPLRNSEPTATTASPPVAAAPTEGSPGATQRTLGYVTAALGIVGVGVGTYFSLRAWSMNHNMVQKGCNDSICPAGSYRDQQALDAATKTAQDAARNGVVTSTVGATLLAGGVVLILAAPSGRASPQVDLSASASRGHGIIRIGGVW